MHPLQIQVLNFLSYRGTVNIDFSNIEAAVITGPNGAGKSSFFIDAPNFALYGTARSQTNEELICDGCNEMSVTYVFEHLNQKYAAVRTLVRGKGQLLKLYCFGTSDDEGEDLSDRLLKNTQQRLLEIIGVSQNLLFNTAIAQQDEVNRLSTITPGEREQVLSEMLGLGVWEDKKKKAVDLINQSVPVIQKIEQLELAIEASRGGIEEAREDLSNKQAKLTIVNNEYTAFQQQLEILQQQNREREQLVAQQTAITNQLTSLRTEIQILEANIEKANAQGITDEQLLIDQIEASKVDIQEGQNLIKQIQGSEDTVRGVIATWDEKLIRISGLQQAEASTSILDAVPCKGMDIHDKCQLLANALKLKQEIIAFLNAQQQNVTTLEEAKIAAKARKFEWDTKYRNFADSKIQLNNRINSLSNGIAKCESSIQIAKDLRKWLSTLESKKLDVRQKQSELSQIRITWNPEQMITVQNNLLSVGTKRSDLMASIQVRGNEIGLLEASITKFQQELIPMQEIKSKTVNCKILHQAYTDIPTLLFTNTIPYIEAYANDFLGRVSSDRRVNLRAYRETKSNTQVKTLDVIGTTSTGLRQFTNLSGSEKFRESLALRIALSKVNAELYNTQIGFFIVDEGFGSLDDTNTLLIKNALREAAKGFDLFLVISHVPELVDTFSSRIIVNPPGKGERLEVVRHAPTSDVALDV